MTTSEHYHALVWIDHREARIFHFNASDSERELVRSQHPNQHLHHKANERGSGHAPVDKDFLARVSSALAAVGAVLITGPGSAKTELADYIKTKVPALAQRISGVEALDHPTDGALLNLGRKFFRADDRMHSQRP